MLKCSLAVLTALVLLLCAGAASSAAVVGVCRRIWGEQQVTGANWGQCGLQKHVIELGYGFFVACVEPCLCLLCGAVAVADGAVVEVQSGGPRMIRAWEVRTCIQIGCAACVADGLFLNGAGYQLSGAECWRASYSQAMSSSLHLQLLRHKHVHVQDILITLISHCTNQKMGCAKAYISSYYIIFFLVFMLSLFIHLL